MAERVSLSAVSVTCSNCAAASASSSLGPVLARTHFPWLHRSGQPEGSTSDVQRPMLDHLVRRAAKARILNIAPAVGDGRKLPYASASFDGAYLIDVLGETSDPPAVLRELRRILRPEGRLVVGEHFIDPDFVSFRSLKERAETAGFTLERRSGTSLVYFARFRPT